MSERKVESCLVIFSGRLNGLHQCDLIFREELPILVLEWEVGDAESDSERPFEIVSLHPAYLQRFKDKYLYKLPVEIPPEGSVAKSAVQLGDHAEATTLRAGRAVGFSESHGRGRAATGDVLESGLVSLGLEGLTSKGEEGTLLACQKLVDHLNSEGGSWASPCLVDLPHIDGKSEALDQSGSSIFMQVVRAVAERDFWKALDKEGGVQREAVHPSELAIQLRMSIQAKASKIPEQHRSEITLILNALDTPTLAFPIVTDEFLESHGSWAKAHGFKQIWIVGPGPTMVRRLDDNK